MLHQTPEIKPSSRESSSIVMRSLLNEPFGDLLTRQTINQLDRVGESLERTREKAIGTWVKYHPGTPPGTKKGAARMGDAFCGRLMQLNARGPDWTTFWHKPQKVEPAGIEPASDLDFRGLLRAQSASTCCSVSGVMQTST